MRFSNKIKHILSICADEDDLILFSPSPNPGRRSGVFALCSHFACLNFLPCWQGQLQADLHKYMLSISVTPTRNWCNSLEAEMHGCKYKMAKAKMSGLPPWRKYMKPNDFLPKKVRTAKEQKVKGMPAELEPVPVEILKAFCFLVELP